MYKIFTTIVCFDWSLTTVRIRYTHFLLSSFSINVVVVKLAFKNFWSAFTIWRKKKNYSWVPLIHGDGFPYAAAHICVCVCVYMYAANVKSNNPRDTSFRARVTRSSTLFLEYTRACVFLFILFGEIEPSSRGWCRELGNRDTAVQMCVCISQVCSTFPYPHVFPVNVEHFYIPVVVLFCPCYDINFANFLFFLLIWKSRPSDEYSTKRNICRHILRGVSVHWMLHV